MAGGADGRVEIALAERRGVSAGGVFRGDLDMAFATSLRDVLLADARAGGQRRVHLMTPVTVDAIGGLDLAARQGGAVHAALEGGHEMPAQQRLFGDRGLGQMAGFAQRDLIELQGETRLAGGGAGDGLPMTGQAVRRIRRALSQGLSVGGGEKLVALRFVAAAACFRLPGGREGKIRRLAGGNGMRAVAG